MADQFEKWLSDTLPETHEDPMEGRIHRAILRDRLRRRNRRRNLGRFAAVAVPALAAVMFFGLVGDLGSDDFELDRLVSEDGSTEVLVQGMQETGFQVLPGQEGTEISLIAQMRAAGDYSIKEVQGWKLGETSYWSVTRVYDLNGREAIRRGDTTQPPSELTEEIGLFLALEWDEIQSRIDEGSIRSTGTTNVVLDGVACTVRTYILQSEGSGEVVYYLGGPTP